jgi:hypothetical protein
MVVQTAPLPAWSNRLQAELSRSMALEWGQAAPPWFSGSLPMQPPSCPLSSTQYGWISITALLHPSSPDKPRTTSPAQRLGPPNSWNGTTLTNSLPQCDTGIAHSSANGLGFTWDRVCLGWDLGLGNQALGHGLSWGRSLDYQVDHLPLGIESVGTLGAILPAQWTVHRH